MKKTIFALSLIVTMAAGSASAAIKDPGTEEAKANFKKEFPGAQLINWVNSGNLLKAIFVYSGYRSEAYFNEEGALQGSARNIHFEQLPLAVTREVERKFTNPVVTEVCELTMENSTSYILSVEAANRKYKIRMDAGGNLITKERIKS